MDGSIAQVRRRVARLGVAAGVVLAAVGAVVTAAAGPAQAVVVNNATAAAAGMVSQSSVVGCPAGQFLSGGAGQVIGGNGDVTLTDIIPDLAAQTVTVWAHSNPGAAPAAYVVVAQAICIAGAAPANYQLVTANSGFGAAPFRTVAVACPAGTTLMGTGARLDNAQGEVFYQRIQPNGALNGAAVSAVASGGFAGNWQVAAYGICATPPAGIMAVLTTATGPNNGASPKLNQPSPACPGAAVTTGVGAQISPIAAGNVMVVQMTANGAQDTALAGGVADGVFLPAWAVTAYNICWG